jgi:hypothetical protein
MAPEEKATPTGKTVPSPRLLAGLCLLLALATFWLYSPSMGFGFVAYDDLSVLHEHPNLYDQSSLLHSLREIFIGYFPREEPLLVRDVTWAIDARLFGFDSTFGYHLGNVLFHAANVGLLFLFLFHATRGLLFAAVTAGLFATLAIHVEPVCWIMGRKDVLGGFFTLLALLTQSIALQQTRPSRRRLLLTVVFFLYPLAVLSKFSAITLVLVLAAHRILAPTLDGRVAAWARLDWKEARRTVVSFLPHAVVGIALYRWYGRILYDYQVIGGRGPSPFSLQHLKTLAVMVPLSIGRIVEHVLSSAQHSISYLRPNVALPLSRADLGLVLLVVVGSALVVGLAARRRKDLLFFVLAFFFWLLPYANIQYVGYWVADRYAYLASACIVALLVQLALAALARARAGKNVVAVALTAASLLWAGYGLATGQTHQRAFRDARTLWSYEVALPDPSMLAYVGLAKSYYLEAEATTDPALRRVLLGEMRSVARTGIQRYRDLPWLPARGYFIAERTEFAQLFALLGRGASLAGDKPERRIQYLRRAYEISPAAPTALLLAKEIFDQALPADLSLARESLGFCADYAAKSWTDPANHASLRAIFGNYTRTFPPLAGEVQTVLDRLGH